MGKFEELCESVIGKAKSDSDKSSSDPKETPIEAKKKKPNASTGEVKGRNANGKLRGPDGTHSLGGGFYGKNRGEAEFRKVGGKFVKIDSTTHHIDLDIADEKGLQRNKMKLPFKHIVKIKQHGPGGGNPVYRFAADKHTLHRYLKKHYANDVEEVKELMNTAKKTSDGELRELKKAEKAGL